MWGVKERRIGEISMNWISLGEVISRKASGSFTPNQKSHIGETRSIDDIEIREGEIFPSREDSDTPLQSLGVDGLYILHFNNE